MGYGRPEVTIHLHDNHNTPESDGNTDDYTDGNAVSNTFTLEQAFGSAERLLAGMEVRLQFKGVTYETLKDEAFLAAAVKAGLDVTRLHEEFEAVKAKPPNV